MFVDPLKKFLREYHPLRRLSDWKTKQNSANIKSKYLLLTLQGVFWRFEMFKTNLPFCIGYFNIYATKNWAYLISELKNEEYLSIKTYSRKLFSVDRTQTVWPAFQYIGNTLALPPLKIICEELILSKRLGTKQIRTVI